MYRRSRRSGAALVLAPLLCLGCGTPPSKPLYFDEPSPIKAVAFSPDDGAVQVAPDVILQVELSREIDDTRLDEAIVTFVDAASTDVPLQAPGYGLRLLTLTPDQQLAQGQQHTVTIENLFDLVGRRVAPVTWSFSTLTDVDPPQLAFFSPNHAGAALSSQITAQFDEELDGDALSPDWLAVVDVGNGNATIPGALRYEALSHSLIFRPNAALPASTTVGVTLNPKIVDRFGNQYNGPLPGWNFDTGTQLDTKAPVFTGGSPSAQYLPPDRIRVEWPSANDDGDPSDELRYEIRAQGPGFVPAGELVAVAYSGQTIDVVDLVFGNYRFLVTAVDASGNAREYPCPTPTPSGPTCPPEAFSQLDGVDFAQQVRPLLQNTCAQPLCHLGQDAPGFVDMSQDAIYQDIVEHVDHVSQLRLVVPFEPDLSYLYWKIGNEAQELAGKDPFLISGSVMPPDQIGPLPYSDVELIRRWIEQGATEEISPP